MHTKGLTHRDVEPSNILLDATRNPMRSVLSDFGLVRPVTGGTLTPGNMALGTVQYISPEQVRDGRAGPESELYVLACVAFECLTGRTPFIGGDVASALARVGAAAPRASSVIRRSAEALARLRAAAD